MNSRPAANFSRIHGSCRRLPSVTARSASASLHFSWSGPALGALIVVWLAWPGNIQAGPAFQLPTANRAIFKPGAEDDYFVGTVGKPWTSGCFGCVRSDGWQLHEGLDIRCLTRDKRGEPADSVLAAADGVVAYVNSAAALSNYGKYIILKHQIEGLEIYSLYAHLSRIEPDIKPGRAVKAGDTIAVMGRTANTSEGISKDRAHLHFELNLLVNDRFAEWYKKSSPGQRNDHGLWNGQNLIGLDPRTVFLEQQRQGAQFSFRKHVRRQTELCRVLVRDTRFPWLTRYSGLVRRGPTAEREGVAGYEIALTYNGLPFDLIPRAESEFKSKARIQLLSVNEAEYKKNPCRKLVTHREGRWSLANNGTRLIELLTY